MYVPHRRKRWDVTVLLQDILQLGMVLGGKKKVFKERKKERIKKRKASIERREKEEGGQRDRGRKINSKKLRARRKRKRWWQRQRERALLIFVACLCHQHPVGTTDVQMMSCRKGIGREGGAIRAREDSGQAEPPSERGKGGERGREGERDQDCGNPSLPCSHAIIQFS